MELRKQTDSLVLLDQSNKWPNHIQCKPFNVITFGQALTDNINPKIIITNSTQSLSSIWALLLQLHKLIDNIITDYIMWLPLQQIITSSTLFDLICMFPPTTQCGRIWMQARRKGSFSRFLEPSISKTRGQPRPIVSTF